MRVQVYTDIVASRDGRSSRRMALVSADPLIKHLTLVVYCGRRHQNETRNNADGRLADALMMIQGYHEGVCVARCYDRVRPLHVIGLTWPRRNG